MKNINRRNLDQILALSNKMDASKYSNYTVVDFYLNLLKYSRKLSRIDVHSCNGTKYTSDGEYEAATQNVYVALRKLIQENEQKLYFYHQSDPRGVALFVSNVPLNEKNYIYAVSIY